MELPVAATSYQPTPASCVRALHHADALRARAAATETILDGCLAFTNPAWRDEPKANFALDLHVPPNRSPAQVIQNTLDHFTAAGVPCHWLGCAGELWPEDLAAVAQAAGFRDGGQDMVLRLDRWTAPTPPKTPVQILPARALLPLLPEFLHREAVDQWQRTESQAQQRAACYLAQLDEPRLAMWVARVDGRLAGTLSVIDLGDLGVIDHVYTTPEHRRAGVGGALLQTAVDHCSRAQFRTVILETRREFPCYDWWLHRGFAPIASYVKMIRHA